MRGQRLNSEMSEEWGSGEAPRSKWGSTKVKVGKHQGQNGEAPRSKWGSTKVKMGMQNRSSLSSFLLAVLVGIVTVLGKDDVHSDLL